VNVNFTLNLQLQMVWKFEGDVWQNTISKPIRLLEILMNDASPGSLIDTFIKRSLNCFTFNRIKSSK